MNLHEWLNLAVERQASDIHLSSGLPPVLRVHGRLHGQCGAALSADQIEVAAAALMTEPQRQQWARSADVDGVIETEGLGRFRFNAFRHHGGPALALRHIPARIPNLQDLRVPAVMADLVLRPSGLLLVTGPTGSGKSSTLAALLQHRLQTRPCHLITLEDPIEFLHPGHEGLVHQRQIGTHAADFSQGLRSALREDPDVIMVGELRDLDTVRLALTAAETGHLVLATLHTAGAARSIDRLIDVFPGEDKPVVRTMLSESLLAVVSQVLCPGRESGRIAVHEVLVATAAARNLIRENKVAQLYSLMQTGAAQGMQTLDQSLAQSVGQRLVIAEQARRLARNPDNMSP
jgi:twitching motility protein PilT